MGLTPKSTPLKGAGGYTTTTPTLKGGAGRLKPMGGGTANKVGTNAATPFRGKRGSNKDTQALLKNTPRTLLDQPPPPEEPEA